MSKLDKIQVLATEHEMFSKRSSVYIGVSEPVESFRYVLPEDEDSFKFLSVKLIPSFIKVCDEAIVNASDAMQNLQVLGKKASSGQIEFYFDPEEDRVTIKNYAPHSIEIREDVIDDKGTKRWLPQTVFTKLHVSSNFAEEGEEKTNHKGGVNGVGSKAITYTSSLFELEIVNKGKLYKQTFKNRGKDLSGGDASTPVIKDTKSPDYVSVSFIPDRKFFKTGGKKLLTEDAVSFLHKRCYDVALMNQGIRIFLNGNQISVTKEKYFSMFGFDTSNYLSYAKEFKRAGVTNNIKVFVFDADNGCGSFQLLLNGLFVPQSSLHTNFISEFSKFLGTSTKRNLSNKTGFGIVKNNISVLFIAQINNIDFTGQTKDNFEYGTFKYGFDYESDLEKIKKFKVWKLCTALKAEDDIDSIEKKAIKLPVNLIEKYEDCELANKKRKSSEIATLIIVEGDSAKGCVMDGLTKEQRKSHGVYPFRGKPLNVLCCDTEKLYDNKEFNDLRSIIGLKVISDPVKNKAENAIGKLRYDRVVILSDQDHDGAHIRGLTVNIFGKFWPHLLEQGFLRVIRTPVINIYARYEKTVNGPNGKPKKVSKSRTIKSCYTIKEFNEWEEFVASTSGTKLKVIPPGETDEIIIPKSSLSEPKYIKGLGTLDKCNSVEVFSLYNDYKITTDDRTMDLIDMVFSRTRAEDRKEWIRFGEEDSVLDTTAKIVTVTELLDTEVRAFSRYNTSRALAGLIDGFKVCNRKIAWVVYNKPRLSGSPCAEPEEQIKVSQLCGTVSGETSYHHGEASLYGAIVSMAQRFIGSNNLNYLLPLGQYGTRISGRSGAGAARYIFTSLNSIMKLIFRKEDAVVTELLKDDGKVIEPNTMIPIIPFILINGATGIGSGYSCNIPKHHPIDVVDQMVDRINGYRSEDLLPWFRYSQCEYQVVNKCSEELNSTDKDYVVPVIYQFAKFDVFPSENMIIVHDLPPRFLFEETKKYYQGISREYIEALSSVKRKGKGKTPDADVESLSIALENAILENFEMTYTGNSCEIKLYLKKEWNVVLKELLDRKSVKEDSIQERQESESDEDGEDQGKVKEPEVYGNTWHSVPTLLSKLRLIDTQNLTFSNAHVISENGDIVKLKGTADVTERFYKYRFKKYKERKAAILKKMQDDIDYKKNIARFVRDIKEDKLNIAKATEKDIIKYLEENDFRKFDSPASYNYLLSIPVRNITIERAKKLELEIEKMVEEMELYRAKKISEIWLEELEELREALLGYSEPVENDEDIRFPFYRK